MISKWQNRWEWNTDPPSKPTNQHRLIPPSLMHSFFVPPLPLDIFFKNPRVSLDSLDQEGIQGESYFVYIRGFWTLSLPRNSCLLWYTVHTHTYIRIYTRNDPPTFRVILTGILCRFVGGRRNRGRCRLNGTHLFLLLLLLFSFLSFFFFIFLLFSSLLFIYISRFTTSNASLERLPGPFPSVSPFHHRVVKQRRARPCRSLRLFKWEACNLGIHRPDTRTHTHTHTHARARTHRGTDRARVMRPKKFHRGIPSSS